jgi:hypothetical protein
MWDIKDCRYDTLCPEGQICGRRQTKRVCDEKTVKEILPLFEGWLRQFSEAPGPRSLGKELAQTLPLEDLLPLYFQHQGSQPLSAKQTCNYLRELAHAISPPLCHPGENEICIPSIRCQACENIPGSSLKEFFDLYSEPFRKLDSVKSLWQLRLGTTMPPTASAVYDILMGKSIPSCSSLAALQRFALTPDDKKRDSTPVFTLSYRQNSCYCDSVLVSLLASPGYPNSWFQQELKLFPERLNQHRKNLIVMKQLVNNLMELKVPNNPEEMKQFILRLQQHVEELKKIPQLAPYLTELPKIPEFPQGQINVLLLEEYKQKLARFLQNQEKDVLLCHNLTVDAETKALQQIYNEVVRVNVEMHRKGKIPTNKIETMIRQMVDACPRAGNRSKKSYGTRMVSAPAFLQRLFRLLLVNPTPIELTYTSIPKNYTPLDILILRTEPESLFQTLHVSKKDYVRLEDILPFTEILNQDDPHRDTLKREFKKVPFVIFEYNRRQEGKGQLSDIQIRVAPTLTLGESKVTLNAVICYTQNHYVSFFRYGKIWFYYDDTNSHSLLDQMDFDLMSDLVLRTGLLYFYEQM